MQKIINFTENALSFLKQSIAEEKCLGMRIEIVSGGCSGMTYELNFVNKRKDEDLLVEEDGVKIFVAPNVYFRYDFGLREESDGRELSFSKSERKIKMWLWKVFQRRFLSVLQRKLLFVI